MYEAQQIKSALTMRQVAEFYGFVVNRQNLAVCPFHNDSKPSLHIYDGQRGFCCFACGVSGDVIDFVSKLYNLKFRDALSKLNSDFNLGIDLDTKPNHQAAYNRSLQLRQEAAKKAKLQAIESWLGQAEDSIAAYTRLMWQLQNKHKPADGNETSQLYRYTVQQFNFYEELHQRIFIDGSFNEQLKLYQLEREEVDKIIGLIHTGRQAGIIG